jgi:2-polyprenyl-3-methyl-5-hydroxy-6-metoxy-1,4-benzoquinol methylase
MLTEAWARQRAGRLFARSMVHLVERDDGMMLVGAAKFYLAGPDGWLDCERAALHRLRGSVLDVGAGAGRLALTLQERGVQVTAIDTSPAAVEVCRQRGVRRAVHASLERHADCGERYDTLALFGNCLGLLESHRRAPAVLASLARLAAPGGRIVAVGSDPEYHADPATLTYVERNRAAGRLPGQWRVRERFRDVASPWFDFLWCAAADLERLVADSPWRLAEVVDGTQGNYVAELVLRRPV